MSEVALSLNTTPIRTAAVPSWVPAALASTSEESVTVNQTINKVFTLFASPASRPPQLSGVTQTVKASLEDENLDPMVCQVGRFAGQTVKVCYVLYSVPGGTQVTAGIEVASGSLGALALLETLAIRRLIRTHLQNLKDFME